MIHGCSRYGGRSSAAVRGSKMGCRTSNAALPSFVGWSSLVIREYAFMRPLPSRGSFAFGWGVGLGELGRCDIHHTACPADPKSDSLERFLWTVSPPEK